ncbi:MAG TPA: hypothetical protein PLP88_12155 [Bacteroidales bacterium]|nr:hypothetical protein [Bacteroidales bacterium]
MGLQAIITYLILAAAISYAGYTLFRIIVPSNNANHDVSCSSGCKSCDAVEVRKTIREIKSNP